jgi:hypothetical protein
MSTVLAFPPVADKAPSEVFAELEGEAKALIPPGEYQFGFDYHETALMFGRAPKLVLWFRVLTMGEHFERRIPRYYNVTRIIGRPARRGRFKVGHSSSFVREYLRLFSTTNRLDRIPMSRFEQHIIVGKVRTVRTGGDQKRIPESLQYSVIDELVRIEQ